MEAGGEGSAAGFAAIVAMRAPIGGMVLSRSRRPKTTTPASRSCVWRATISDQIRSLSNEAALRSTGAR